MILLLSQRLFGHLLVTSRKSVNTGVFVGQLLRWTPMWPTWNVTSITAINHRKPVRLVFYNCRWFQDALKCHICHLTQHTVLIASLWDVEVNTVVVKYGRWPQGGDCDTCEKKRKTAAFALLIDLFMMMRSWRLIGHLVDMVYKK